MDPSMSNWGLAVAYIFLDTLEIQVEELIVVSPEKEKDIKAVRSNSKDIRIAEQLLDGIIPLLDDADIIVAEVPVAGQNARSGISYAMCVSILAAINLTFTKVIEVTPNDVKLMVKKNASKPEMIAWATKKHPEADWVYKPDGTLLVKHAEHVSDAIAALYAAMKTAEFKTILNSIKRLSK